MSGRGEKEEEEEERGSRVENRTAEEEESLFSATHTQEGGEVL